MTPAPKPTLVMIHGLIGSLAYFDPQSKIDSARVSTPDLRGYGSLRGVPADSLTLAAQVDHLVEQLQGLGSAPLWLLGHSMGGAIAMMLADRLPEKIAGIINVEGNFTLGDAFWSSKIAKRSSESWATEYKNMQCDPAAWLQKCGVAGTAPNIQRAKQVLSHQSPDTVQAMSRAIVRETALAEYALCVRRVVERGCPIHLIAGQRSVEDWDVPEFVRAAARSFSELPDTGHMMMLEDPQAFCGLVDDIVRQVQEDV